MLSITMIVLVVLVAKVRLDYLSIRNNILKAEKSLALGGDLVLTDKEKEANHILLRVKNKELEEVQNNVSRFPAAKHFYYAKSEIEKSKVFSIIQKLPKGASLHTHLTASTSFEYLFNSITQRDNMYACTLNGRLKLKFFGMGKTDQRCKWQLVRDLRKKSATFDNFIKSKIRLLGDGTPPSVYKDAQDVWKTFRGLFRTIKDIIRYKSFFQDYLYRSLAELYNDKVFYVEFRTNFRNLYELNGTTYKTAEFVKTFSKIVERFKREHPGFIGARIIYSRSRNLNATELEKSLVKYNSLQNEFPKYLAGFDLLDCETDGRPLIDFYQQFESFKNTINFFFHAGETNWYGFEVDHNLLDAVLLGTKRIGHGYALLKHPKILELVKQNDIAIEISPISNQVLMLINDLRNHPAAALIAQGFPIVVCNDDPSFWGVAGLSYDWYMVYMSMARKDAGLEFLKQLALNSIKYSAIPESQKSMAFEEWNVTWTSFISDIIKNKDKY